ncbi:MAG: YggS family pyridoxal phosphate-dependent enzyme [Planctomycetia bacterium]|nr:YggS family pyridoxal phosphate-dependent enzyme [Planctomycetia bacterium]
MAEACRRAGRGVGEVTLIGVTKYVGADVARILVECGCRELAESRPQQLWDRAAALADLAPHWHLVGHLQRNKVHRTVSVVSLMHTLDSLRLLTAIEAEAASAERSCDVLVEVNLTADPERSGCGEADVPALVAAAVAAPHVRLRGLMGMASHPDAAGADARRDFARLREIRDRLAREVPPEMLRELSMGMSGDFEEAILEGSTMVRIGSALFEGLR